jgi:hypothetical protein
MSHLELNNLEHRVTSAREWLDDVGRSLRDDQYFAAIVQVLENRTPDLHYLPAKEARA